MDEIYLALITLGLIVFYLGSGLWIFIGLILVSLTLQFFALGFSIEKMGAILARILLRSSSSWELAAVPMFIWMGEIIFRTDISRKLFLGLAPFARLVPGRLLHTNVAGSALFAAISGSSTATTVTVGNITLKELADRGYSKSLAIGSLAGAGSLGLLIPPSIVMIVYGVLAEVSIIKLFAAGVLPGLIIAALYSLYLAIVAMLFPKVVGSKKPGEEYVGWGTAIANLLPVVALMGLVLGSIYSGLATPSEAAAIGVVSAVAISFVMGQLSISVIQDSLNGAVKTSAMVISLLVAAALLSNTMGYLRLPQNLASFVAELELSPFLLIGALAVLYILLGMFLDGISITVMSLPIALPLILDAGFDPIWFGVFLILMVELATITPPVGFNLFVIQGLTGASISSVAWAAVPFFLLMCIAVVLLTIWPEIALWLPEKLSGRPAL